jgi:hypothetical protein
MLNKKIDVVKALQAEKVSLSSLLTLLSLTIKVARMVTAPGMLVGTHKHRYRVYTSSNRLGNVFGKTHDHRKVRKRTYYHCSTSPGGIRVIVFIFSQGRHYDKDYRINGGENTRLGKEL